MAAPIKAEVVNAFMSSLREIVLSATGLEGVVAPVKVTSDGPVQPDMMVVIQLTGKLSGPAIYSFEPAVAREIAGRMLATEAPPFDSPETRDAVGELANILVGNATGALQEEGYPIEISTPSTSLAGVPMKLDPKGVRVALSTAAGKVSLLLCLTQTPRAEP